MTKVYEKRSTMITTNRHGKLTYRVTVPACLREYYNKKELYKGLRTSELTDEVKLKVDMIDKEFKKIKDLVKMKVLSKSEIQRLVDEHIATIENTFGTSTDSSNPKTPLEQFNDDKDNVIGELKLGLATNDYSFVEDDMLKVISQLGQQLDKESYNQVAGLLLQNYINKLSGVTPPKEVPVQSTPTADTKHNIAKYVEDYIEYYENRGISKTHMQTNSYALRTLLVNLLPTQYVEDVTSKMLKELEATLYKLPVTTQKPFNQDKGNFALIKEAIGNPAYKIVGVNTVAGYIGSIKKFFDYLWKEGITTTDKSHLMKVKREATKREFFTDDDYNLYKNKLLDDITDKQKGTKHQMLIIYMFTPMRREELYNSEIIEKDGVITFYITDGKNKFAKRFIPVHEQLLKIFNDLGDLSAKDMNKRLQANKKTIGLNRFGRYFNEKIATNPKHTLHQTRKYFITRQTKNKVPEGIRNYLSGHTLKGVVNEVYIDNDARYSMKELQEAVNKF